MDESEVYHAHSNESAADASTLSGTWMIRLFDGTDGPLFETVTLTLGERPRENTIERSPMRGIFCGVSTTGSPATALVEPMGLIGICLCSAVWPPTRLTTIFAWREPGNADLLRGFYQDTTDIFRSGSFVATRAIDDTKLVEPAAKRARTGL